MSPMHFNGESLKCLLMGKFCRKWAVGLNTVDPEIFARILFLLILANWLPREFKVFANKEAL